jgi:hypothetical protein
MQTRYEEQCPDHILANIKTEKLLALQSLAQLREYPPLILILIFRVVILIGPELEVITTTVRTEPTLLYSCPELDLHELVVLHYDCPHVPSELQHCTLDTPCLRWVPVVLVLLDELTSIVEIVESVTCSIHHLVLIVAGFSELESGSVVLEDIILKGYLVLIGESSSSL